MATDFFLSYRTKRHAEVQALLMALRGLGCTVWRDEEGIRETESISDGVRSALSGSRAMIVWASPDYHDSPICRIELSAAWVAAQQLGRPQDRVFFVLSPGTEVRHLPPVRAEADVVPFSAPTDAAGWAILAEKLRERLPSGTDRLGDRCGIQSRVPWYPRVRQPSNRFVGRQQELWWIHAKLQSDRQVAVTGVQKAAPTSLQGLGGLGKSTLAIEYAHLFEAAWPGGIFWLNLADGQLPEQREATLARSLGIEALTDADRAAALRRHLQAQKEPYLWILDGVPPEIGLEIVEAQCAPGGRGCTLITTRSRAWKSLGNSRDLDVLSPEDALRLLLHRRQGQPVENREAALRLCKKVGYLPIALDLLAAMQEERQHALRESEWIRRLDRTDKDLLELAAVLEEELPTDCSKSIAEVMRQSLKVLKEESWALLLALSVMAEAPVSDELMEEVLGGEEQFLGAVSKLRRHSLVGAKDLHVHPLLRRVLERDTTRTKQREQGRRRIVEVMTGRLGAIDAEDVRTHGTVVDLLPHVMTVVGEKLGLEEAELLFWAARLWLTRGTYGLAQGAFERAFEARLRLRGPKHPDTLLTLADLATLSHAQNDFHGARTILEPVFDILIRDHGPEHPYTLTCEVNLAATLYSQGDLSGARKRQERVLATRIRVLGAEHFDTVTTRLNLASTQCALGDKVGARAHQEQVVESLENLRGPEHPTTLTAKQNLASTLLDLGDAASACAIYENVLDARTRILTLEHPHTLHTLLCLALARAQLGDLEGFRRCNEQLLGHIDQALGQTHTGTNAARYGLVHVLLKIDPPAAIPHILILSKLQDRAPETLAASDRQIVDALPELKARAGMAG